MNVTFNDLCVLYV